MSDEVKITPVTPPATPVTPDSKPGADSVQPDANPQTSPVDPKPDTQVFQVPVTPAGTNQTKAGLFKKKPNLKGKNKKRKKKIIIAVIIIAIILGLIIWGIGKLQAMAQPPVDPEAIYRGDVTQVMKDDVIKSVTLKGTLQSAQSVTLFSTVSSKVQALDVKAGDRVQTGQRIAQLDTSELQQNLASQQASAQDAQVTKQNAIAEAQETYQNFNNALINGMNPEIIAAQNAVKNAESEYQKAVVNLNSMAQQKRDGTLQSVLEQDQALRQAYQELENTKLDKARIDAALKDADKLRSTEAMKLEGDRADLASTQRSLAQKVELLKTTTEPDAKAALEEEIAALNGEVISLQAAVEQGEASVGAAKDSYDGTYSESKAANLKLQQVKENLGLARRQARQALNAIDKQLAEARDAVNKAQDGIAEAKVSLQQAQIAANTQNNANIRALRAAQQAGGTAETGQAISKLRTEINSATVTSPINGIVTSVGVKVGAAPEGAIAVVEDDKNLVISTAVKEKDVAKLKLGNEVHFTTPATGDKEFTGVIAFVSPAATVAAPVSDANAGPSGGDSSGGGVTFPVEIKVTGDLDGLRLGSSVKAKAVTEGQRGVLTVPSSALVDSPSFVPDEKAGDNVEWPKSILVVDGVEENKPKVREIQVKVLAEASGTAAISGDGLEEGLNVLNNATDYIQLVGEGSPHFVDTPIHGEMEMPGGTLGY